MKATSITEALNYLLAENHITKLAVNAGTKDQHSIIISIIPSFWYIVVTLK